MSSNQEIEVPVEHIFFSLIQRAKSDSDRMFCSLLTRSNYEHVSQGAIVKEAITTALRLRAAGVRFGEIVPIILEHRRELYSSFIGCTLLGAVPAFLPPLTSKQDRRFAGEELAALLKRIRSCCIITSNETHKTLPASMSCAALNVDEVLSDSRDQLLPPLQISGNSLAFLQHSSGTTGSKKGVAISHDAVMHQIRAYSQAIDLSVKDLVASWLPLYHDMGLITSFLMPAVTGIPIVSVDALEWTVRPTLLFDAVECHHASLCWLPNFAFHHIARTAEPDRLWDLSSLRLVINCSEPCKGSAFDTFLSRFSRNGLRPEALQVSYAMAENVFAITQTPPEQLVRRSLHKIYEGYLSCGPALKNAKVRLVLKDGTEAGDGELGEIYVASDCLFSEYFCQPNLSAERLKEGWYRTGDLGFHNEGELFIVGRHDDLININGRKFLAHDVEQELNNINGIAPGRVLVYSEHNASIGTTSMAIAAERISPTFAEDQILATAIRKKVVDISGLRPTRVTIFERGFLLKSTSGKISRAASIKKINNQAISGENGMTKSEILKNLHELVLISFPDAGGLTISAETTADQVPGWDSLSHAIFLMNVENSLHVRFEPADVIGIDNIGDLCSLIGSLLSGSEGR